MAKRLILILGPNGVGKSTVCAELLSHIPHSAYIDTDMLKMANPAEFTDQMITLHKKNILSLMHNYFHCGFVDTILLPYGIHGHRKAMLREMIADLQDHYDLHIDTVILTCSEEENVRRMKSQGRDDARIARALQYSRYLYQDTVYPLVDVTNLTVKQTAMEIIGLLPVWNREY